jgi:hypothetical protein
MNSVRGDLSAACLCFVISQREEGQSRGANHAEIAVGTDKQKYLSDYSSEIIVEGRRRV